MKYGVKSKICRMEDFRVALAGSPGETGTDECHQSTEYPHLDFCLFHRIRCRAWLGERAYESVYIMFYKCTRK